MKHILKYLKAQKMHQVSFLKRLFLLEQITERKRERNLSPGSFPKWPVWSRQPGAYFQFPQWVQGPNALGHHLLLSQTIDRAASKVEQIGPELMPIWDACQPQSSIFSVSFSIKLETSKRKN